ncbi:MAG: hypothetical protein U0324_46940 [Polyangiales bacterium]
MKPNRRTPTPPQRRGRRPIRNAAEDAGKGEGKTPTTPAAPAGISEADAAARAADAVKSALKELGFEKLDDAKAAVKAQREAEESKKSELERATGKVAELAPRAKRAEALEGTIKRYLDAEEKSVPKEKRELLDLAPAADSPEARLEWILSAKAKGLFGPAAEAKPANTRAGGSAPPANAPGAQKHPRDMNDAEFAAFQAERRAKNGAG